ncbi:refilin-A isoform X2 [Choloepus didactylus]|uniref:refilin-A isoform X2 n=1 Tax=Choloepus didactylus TaxID=27675 RepID=UPI00189D5972|nr:refilin-A isoform X2 [Choloepus didactylus]
MCKWLHSKQPPALRNPPVPEMRPRMLPVFFGESIEVNPEPTHEIRCNAQVKYASEKHFRDDVFCAPVPTVTAYSETIMAAPNCTWRSYRSQLTLEPRPRALRFQSTTIIFPKHAQSSFRTTLHCSLGRPRRWFASSVQLAPCEDPRPCLLGTKVL